MTQKSNLFNMGLLGFLAVVIACLPSSVWAQADQVNNVQASQRPVARVITVQGLGEVQAKPDLARLTVGVQTQNIVAETAVRENATRTDAVIKAVRAAGVAEADIQTSDFSINPNQEIIPDSKPLANGSFPTRITYQVNNTVRVTVRRVADTGKVIDAVVKAGANLASGISFDLNEANAQKARDEALTRAVTDARRKAEVIARAAKLGRIDLQSITQNETVGGPIPMFRGRVAMAAEAATPVQAGELTISATITAGYTFNPDVKENY